MHDKLTRFASSQHIVHLDFTPSSRYYFMTHTRLYTGFVGCAWRYFSNIKLSPEVRLTVYQVVLH